MASRIKGGHHSHLAGTSTIDRQHLRQGRAWGTCNGRARLGIVYHIPLVILNPTHLEAPHHLASAPALQGIIQNMLFSDKG